LGLKSDDISINCDVIFHDAIYVASTNSYIPASGKYTIESKATDSTNPTNFRIVRVSLSQITTTPSATIGRGPTDNLLFINGEVSNDNFNFGEADGDVFVKGNLSMASGSQ